MTKKQPKVSEVVARPTRGAMQLAVAVALVSWFDDHVQHLSHQSDAILSVSPYNLAVGIAVVVVGAAWVRVENGLGAGILRAVPPKDAPIVDTESTPAEPSSVHITDESLEALADVLADAIRKPATKPPARKRTPAKR